MTKIAFWISIRANDWTAKGAIITGSGSFLILASSAEREMVLELFGVITFYR